MELVHARWELRPADGGPAIRGDLRAPQEVVPRSAIIICHGFKGFKDWGFFPALARSLASRGHVAVSFNFSGSGVGADGVDFSDLDGFSRARHTRNVAEIRQVIDAVADGRLLPRKPRRIGLFGHSRGGGEAVLAAAAEPRVQALVTWAAIATVERWADDQIAAWEAGETVHIENARTGQQMPIRPEYWHDLRDHRDRLDIAAAAARVAAPWLIVHGADDDAVSAADGKALFDAAGDEAELYVIEGAGHTFGAKHPYAGPTDELRAAVEATADWFDRHLVG